MSRTTYTPTSIRITLLAIFLYLTICNTTYAQHYANKATYLIDSLDLDLIKKGDQILLDTNLANYRSAVDDTSRINVINIIVEECWDEAIWPKYNQWVYTIVKAKLDSIQNNEISESTSKKLFFLKKALAGATNNIGYMLDNQGQSNLALDYYAECILLHEEINNKEGLAASYVNIGAIHEAQGNTTLALEYFLKSLELHKELNDQHGTAISYMNIGATYSNLDSVDLALTNLSNSLKIQEELRNKGQIASLYNKIGVVKEGQGNWKIAYEYYNKALNLHTELGYKRGIAMSYLNLANVSHKNDEKKVFSSSADAYKLAVKSLTVAREIGNPYNIKISSALLSKMYTKRGDYKKAFEMRNLEILMKDSLQSKANIKATANQKAKYEYEKHKAIDKVAHQKELEKQNEIAREEKEKQQIIIYAIASGLILIIAFSFLIYRRLQVTKQQKLTIEEQSENLAEANEELNQTNEEIAAQRDQIERQKESVEEAHNEVQSSINYAERIQNALLSTDEHWQNVSSEHFILFKPRDVVSGDFYWAYSDQDLVYWVAADCTGHGVPGAFMSMLGVSFLNEIVAEGGETNAGMILTKLRAKVIKTLEQEGEEQRKDGMDIALCVLNKKTNLLQFSGAYNPLFIIRANSIEEPVSFEKKLAGETSTLFEFRADRMPIGKFVTDDPFNTQEIQLHKGDCLYTFTDGYQDQFGGTEGKKYMIKRMKKLLLEVSAQPSHEQHEILNTEFEEWVRIGKTEQIDDVCIVGVNI